MTPAPSSVVHPAEVPAPGTIVGPVEVGPVAHGGHCVARFEGRVIFVRHAIPGEQVTIRLTDTGKAKFWRGDVAEVVEPSAHRVAAPCPVAGSCGGCDFQHVSVEHQLELKRRVVAEQLRRLAGLEWSGVVEQVGGPLGWRSRMRYVTETGRAGLRAHRSHDVVELPEGGCRIADAAGPAVAVLDELAGRAGGEDLQVATGEPVSVMAGRQVLVGRDVVRQQVGAHAFEVATDGFWQPHREAPRVLTEAVLEALDPRAGEVGLDLYCGVGLFAAALAGRGVKVVGVEANRAAVARAKLNVPGARFLAGPLERKLKELPGKVDLVVLDPPRSGAGAAVVKRLAGLGARAIAYVACDPAALARDLATFAECGWVAEEIRAFDLFPMTHHVECVALLTKTGSDLR